MNPTVSVIMPMYNARQHVAASVRSVLDQTLQSIEVIVVDDGSTDDSQDEVRQARDSRVTLLRQDNRGVSAARNLGLSHARGECIAFLDADDTWDAGCLEQLHEALIKQPDAAIAYCGWQNLGLPGGRGQPYVPPDYEAEGKLEAMLEDCPWPIHAALTRTSAVRTAGGFDERFANGEDYGMWLKIACHNTIVRVPRVLAFYHHHTGTQASRNAVRAAVEAWQIQREFLERHPAVLQAIGRRRAMQLVNGGLLRRGFECYWRRDLREARQIFRRVMRTGYGGHRDWKYMLPALLPYRLHAALVQVLSHPHVPGDRQH
jgi:glycosyltransferase involved in cell wall biosynthesis